MTGNPNGGPPDGNPTARRSSIIRLVVVAAAVAALIAFVVLISGQSEPEAVPEVQTFADLGQEHIEPAGPIPDYNSNPPTSGPHAPQPAPCGVFRQEVPDVFQVHNLEHGTVIIQYRTDLAETDRDALEEFARDSGTHILVAPRANLDTPIILTAWTSLLQLDQRDDQAIQAFYYQYSQAGPERGVPCPFQVDEGVG